MAGRQSARDTKGYAALQVKILSDKAWINRQRSRAEVADALGQERMARSARGHIDGQAERAMTLNRQGESVGRLQA
jgi:hypothetical protein